MESTNEILNNNTLREYVLKAMLEYFDNFNGEIPKYLSNSVLEEVEAAIYEAVMKFAKGNQVRAAKVLGVSRGTLRTKLKQYFDTTHVGGLYHKWQFQARPKAATMQHMQ